MLGHYYYDVGYLTGDDCMDILRSLKIDMTLDELEFENRGT